MRNRIDKKPIDVVYITGQRYCGSTLIAFLLNAHPKVFTIGEMGPALRFRSRDYLCSCGEPLYQCPFFNEMTKRMNEEGLTLDFEDMRLRYYFSENRVIERLVMGGMRWGVLREARNLLRWLAPGFRQHIRELDHRNEVFMRSALNWSGKSVFLDTTKNCRRIVFLARMKRLNLKVIHLIRDPRGFCCSVQKHERRSPVDVAPEWTSHINSVRHLTRRMPEGSYMPMLYESFCHDPETHLRKITDFIGVEKYNIPDNYRDFPHHILGNPMAKHGDNRTKVTLDESWQSLLTKEDRKLIAQLTGETAREVGYQI
ncbi:sulfotransferase [Candidatus Hydrogenedentota bacterium]